MKTQPRTAALAAFALCASACLPACSGGPITESYLYGTLSVSLTDAASDKVESFRIEVSGIDVVKSNNTLLHALAGPLVVDLADLRETGQLINSLTASVGSYSRVSITLDPSTAVCVLAGQSAPATIHDDQGADFLAPVVVTLNIPGFLMLDGSEHALIELDLDLDQSLQVDTGNNTVEFAPALFVRSVQAQQKPLSLTGTIESVDVANSNFVLALEDENQVPVAHITCASDGATVFQNDGIPSTGNAGLTDLSLLPLGTWVEAQATLDPLLSSVLVSSVHAGVGTWNGGTDFIDGHVVDRVGLAGADATLTVLGRSSNAAHDASQYDTSFSVATTFLGTQVVRQGSSTDYDSDALGIGQHVRIYGTLTGASMDASAGLVRQQPTWIFGTATGVPAGGQLVLSLVSVGLHPEALYNFTTPTAFVTDVGTLADLLAIDNGTNVVERGFLPAVGGGGADFRADAVLDVDTEPVLLLVRNRLTAGFALTLTPTTGQIDVTVAGPPVPGELAILDRGFAGSTNLPGSPTPDIQPIGTNSIFMLRDVSAGTCTLYTHFPTFSSAVNAAIGLGAGVRHVAATGDWAAVTGTLHPSRVSIVVE